MNRERTRVERRARLVIERVLQRSVVIHDDGSRPGLYDLRVGTAAAPEIAIECVGAVDPVRTEAWNIGPAQGPIASSLTGDWGVALRPTARTKNVRAGLERLLRDCEQQHVTGFVPVDHRLRRRNPSLYAAFHMLDVASVHCFREEGNGMIHLGMTGISGTVDTEGRAVPVWIADFLRATGRADVLYKLVHSGAGECHAYVPISFAGVPWEVESYLGGLIETLPSSPPDLPVPVTAVWITYGVNGLLWDGMRWQLFDAFVSDEDL